MSYSITPEQAGSITDPEMAFATTRLLPPREEVPEEFFSQGNKYAEIVEALFFGRDLPNTELTLNEGFTPEMLNRCVMAHLKSFQNKHEYKIAAIAYMFSLMATLSPDPDEVAA